MTNRPDLIEQLSKLTPTEGKWVNNQFNQIHSNRAFIGEMLSGDDCELTILAPTMRIEILAMAKEIEELRNGVSVLMESHNKKDAEIKELKDKDQFYFIAYGKEMIEKYITQTTNQNENRRGNDIR